MGMDAVNISTNSFDKSSDDADLISFMKDLLVTNDSNELTVSTYLNETDLHYNISNITVHTADWRDAYKPILDFLLLIILIVVMLSMGCEITWKNLFGHIKWPVGLCIGMVSQFGIMPLSAYSILRVSGIRGLHAAGVLIISCCPGGVLSNTFTYFCEGDLSLSVTMTCVSTVIAMGMMPLNIWLYGRYFESDDLVIPYGKMATSMITVTTPVLVGMLMKWKIPRIASITTKVGGYCGILIMFVCIAMEIVLFPNMFSGVPVKLYIVIVALPMIGLTLGYGFASLMRQNPHIRKTISIECGVQNVPLALTVVALSFPIEMQEDIVLLPWLYLFAQMTGCTVICLTYHFYFKYSQRKEETYTEVAMKEASLLEDTRNGEFNNGVKIEVKPSFLKNGKQKSEASSHV